MEHTQSIKASVVIRAYNAEATIERAIQSALAQSVPADSFEIIIVDDGSTDSSPSILSRYAERSRIRVIRQENQGSIKAANVGFKHAEGAYVALLDSDDEWDPRFLEKMSFWLDTDPSIDFAYADYFEEFDGQRTHVEVSDLFKTVAGNTLYRRASLAAASFYTEGVFFAEYDLLLRTFDVWKGIRIAEPLIVYHRRRNSISANSRVVHAGLEELMRLYPKRESEITRIRSYALGEQFHIRPILSEDVQFLFDVRNDELTRQNSATSTPLEWNSHSEWVNTLLSGGFPGRALYVVENESGEPVGTVRSDEREDGFVEISYALARGWRGKGIGKRMVLQFVQEKLAGKKLVARIKKDANPASEGVARALGLKPFSEIPPVQSGDTPMVEWR